MDTLDYKEPITKIYFVRHGQTKANKERLLCGHLNIDLNKEGIKQSKRAASRLSKVKADYIISSPLKRAKHTARIIAVEAGFSAKGGPASGGKPASTALAQIILDKNLIEKSEGLWEGKSYWEVRKDDPKSYKQWLKDPYRNRPPKGESVLDLDKRVKKFYKTVLKKYNGKKIIVVCHSGPIRLFILHLLKANINKFWHLKVENGSITEIHLSKKHAMVWAVNRI